VEIDWFTFFIQIINFLILVVLLRMFLYKPVIRAMEEREAKIAARLKEAEDRQKEAEQEVEDTRQARAELEATRDEYLAKAKEEVEARRKEMLEAVRREADELQTRWQETLEREKTAFLQQLRRRAGEQVFTVARRALADLADADLEQHIIQNFLKRLETLGDSEREALSEALPGSNGRVQALSAFEIPGDMQKKIRKAIHDQIDGKAEVEFEVSSDLIGGIELKLHGHEVKWSVMSYLETLEEQLLALVEEEAR
jgi:F-type H+-transporting ATPase subunit b